MREISFGESLSGLVIMSIYGIGTWLCAGSSLALHRVPSPQSQADSFVPVAGPFHAVLMNPFHSFGAISHDSLHLIQPISALESLTSPLGVNENI